MITLTPMEFDLMDAIALDQMNPSNGEAPQSVDEVNTLLWTDELATTCNLTIPQVKGLLGSLTAKQAIWIVYENAKDLDDGIGFTDAGFDAWLDGCHRSVLRVAN